MSGMIDFEAFDGLGLAELVRKRDVTALELLTEAVERVERHDPHLNAVVCRFEGKARAAIMAGLPDGPFSGVPFLLKDLGAHYAGEPTTSGSRFFADYVPGHDSEVTRRYKAAGLVCFGKTNTPEFGLSPTTEPALFGPTLNPWDTSRTAGGSSGGAAAAVAARMVPMAHASDGGGSIRIPAAMCGLFGLKPTRGRVPMGPDAGEGWGGLSTVHAVTHSVRDSAALLDVVEGADLGAPYWAPPKARPFLDEVGAPTGRLRIAFSTRPTTGVAVDPVCVRAAEDAARLCADLGHHVEEANPSVADPVALGTAMRAIIGANVRATFDERAEALGRAPGPDDAERMTHAIIRNAEGVSAATYARAIRLVHATGRQVAQFFQTWDVLITPTLTMQPPRIGELSMMAEDMAGVSERIGALVGFTSLYNITGQPAMSVPLSWSEAGLPVGVQFVGRFGDEAGLIRLASQLEQARPWAQRRP